MLTWKNYEQWLSPILKNSLPADILAPMGKDFITDSKSIKPGQWFVALKGQNHDGHTFIADAINNGAIGIVVSESWAIANSHIKIAKIVVSDTLKAFQLIAKGWRNIHQRVKVIAITGSVGKTTTKELLQNIFNASGPTLYAQGNFNNEIGVPKTLLQITDDCQYAVLELGARKRGDIALLTDLSNPQIVCCLNIGTAHLEIFGSQKELENTKLEIYTTTPNATAVINIDDERMVNCLEKLNKTYFSFGKSKKADVLLKNVAWLPDGSMGIELLKNNQSLDITLPVAHEAYPENVLAATAVAMAAQISDNCLKQGLSQFKGVYRRYQVISKDQLSIIDDTYNAHPKSMHAGLSTVKKAYPNHKKILVLGDMLELGELTKKAHEELGEFCALLNPSLLITVGSFAALIAEQAIKSGLPSDCVLHFANVDQLIAKNIDFKKFGSILYAKASNSINLHKLLKTL